MTAATAHVVRVRALVEIRDPRDGSWIKPGAELGLDLADDADARFARFLDTRRPPVVEVLEGVIPSDVLAPQPIEREKVPAVVAFEDLASREIRKRQLVLDEETQRRRERVAEAEARVRTARRAIGGKGGANGDAAKLEKALAEAEASLSGKQAALDAFLEETAAERQSLESALPIAEARERRIAATALRRPFDEAFRNYIAAAVELVNRSRDIADARNQFVAAAKGLGGFGEPWVPEFAVEAELKRYRRELANLGIVLSRDDQGRLTIAAGRARDIA